MPESTLPISSNGAARIGHFSPPGGEIRGVESTPVKICVDRAPNSFLVDDVSFEMLADAYSKAGWHWGCPGKIPSAEEISKTLSFFHETVKIRPLYDFVSSGGLTLKNGSIYAHERIFFKLPREVTNRILGHRT